MKIAIFWLVLAALHGSIDGATVSITTPHVTVSEGETAHVGFHRNPAGSTIVYYSLFDITTSGAADYTGEPSIIYQGTETIDVVILSDGIPEGDEIFEIRLTNSLMGDTIDPNSATATVTILGDTAATNDPHVVLTARGLDIPVCFDLTGVAGQVFKLFENINYAYVFEVLGRLRGDNYFDEIEVKEGGKRFIFTPTNVSLGNRAVLWNDLSIKEEEMLKADPEGNWIDVETHKHTIRVELAKAEHIAPFLNFYVMRMTGKAGGMIGTVLSTDYKMYSATEKRGIISANRGHINAEKSSRFGGACWFVEGNGEGLYPGRKEDYIVR